MDDSHPGKFLAEKMFTVPGLTGLRLAAKLQVSHTAIAEILNCRRGISAEMGLRLAKFFKTTPEYWLLIQMRYELKQARRKLKLEDDTTFDTAGDFEHELKEECESNKDSESNKDCADWKEQIRKSEFVREEGIEDVFRVYERLGDERVSFDALAYELQLNGGQLSAILVGLELSGWVKRLPGDYYVRSR